MSKIVNGFVVMMAMFLITPSGALAWDRYQFSDSERSNDLPRGRIKVTNDWRDTVSVTMWTNKRERIGDPWEIDPDESAMLAIDGRAIKVRPSYKIKVGEDWGWVDLGDVARYSEHYRMWFVNVRDIWQATHHRGERRRGERVPDWR